MHHHHSHDEQLLQKIASKAATSTMRKSMFCDCSLQTPFGLAEQLWFQAQGMLMDAHCSCKSACETRALPEFSNSARVKKTRFAGLVAHLLPHLHKALQQHGQHAHAYIDKHMTPCSTPICPQGDTAQTDCQQSHGCLAWTLVSLHVTAASTSTSFRLCRVTTTVSGAFRCRQRLQSCCSPIICWWSMQVQLGTELPLLGCSRCTAYIQPCRQDCPHETRGQRLLPEHVSAYISPARGVLGDRSDGVHRFGKSQYHHGDCSGP